MSKAGMSFCRFYYIRKFSMIIKETVEKFVKITLINILTRQHFLSKVLYDYDNLFNLID
jgi:hypothetical protein